VHHQNARGRLAGGADFPATDGDPFSDCRPADKTTTSGTRQSVRIHGKYFGAGHIHERTAKNHPRNIQRCQG
jgi:hypothetical protein